VRNFIFTLIRTVKKTAGNKTISGNCVWEREYITQYNTYCLIKAVKVEIFSRMTRRTINVVVAVAAAVEKVWWQNCQCSLQQEVSQ
jgi:hypothetical protein